jgi:hypothetical protein
MKNKILLLAPALALPALLAFRSAPAMVNFAPAEGSVATKTFESIVELTLDSMDMTLNGQESPMVPDMDMSMTSKLKVAVTDEYVALRENAPKKLRRTFDDLGNSMSMSMQVEVMGNSNSSDKTVESESELEGKTVVFTWNEDEGKYTKAFESEGEDEEQLEGVLEDMDLRALLPKGEVAEGDTWNIDVKGLLPILSPGGDLKLVPTEADDMMEGGMPGVGSMSDWIGDLLEGEATGTFVGMREVDGVKVAVIKVEVDIQSARDMTSLVLDALENADMPPEVQNMEFEHVDVEFELEGEGELLWDASAGRARSFHMSGPTRVQMDMGMSIEVPGQGSMAIEQVMEMSGTSNISVTFE